MEDINILLSTASNFCQKGEFQQGIHLYSKYIEQDQQNALAYYQRGKAYFKIKDFNAASSDLTKAITLQPDEAHFYGERGLIYYMAKNSDKAIADFNEAVSIEPENPFRYASRAFIKDGLNDLEGAKKDYQKALELDPEDAISYNNLGMVMEKMGNRNKAQKHFEKAGEIDPKNFGMRKSGAPEADSEVPQPLNAPLPEIKRTESAKSDSTFSGTLKSILTSQSEREEFWKFVKSKVFNSK
jgi:tetratricopeptide (TPR) repeat protein